MQILSKLYESIQEVNVVEPLTKSDHNIIKLKHPPMGMHHKVIILQYFSKKEDFYIEEVRNSLKGKVRKLKSMQHGGSLKVPY